MFTIDYIYNIIKCLLIQPYYRKLNKGYLYNIYRVPEYGVLHNCGYSSKLLNTE